MYKRSYKVENFQKANFQHVGKYEIPLTNKQEFDIDAEIKPFNFSKTHRCDGVHFFIHDYQFQRIFDNIETYTEIFKKYKYVFTPDCSLYTNYPLALQIWQIYKKQFVGAFLQSEGVNIVNTVTWGDEKSFEFCFDGIEKGSFVGISDVGTSKESFLMGYHQMLRRIEPTQIILHGTNKHGVKHDKLIAPLYRKFEV